MKKGISLLLALILCLGCFTGCVGSIDNSAVLKRRGQGSRGYILRQEREK